MNIRNLKSGNVITMRNGMEYTIKYRKKDNHWRMCAVKGKHDVVLNRWHDDLTHFDDELQDIVQVVDKRGEVIWREGSLEPQESPVDISQSRPNVADFISGDWNYAVKENTTDPGGKRSHADLSITDVHYSARSTRKSLVFRNECMPAGRYAFMVKNDALYFKQDERGYMIAGNKHNVKCKHVYCKLGQKNIPIGDFKVTYMEDFEVWMAKPI